MTSALMPDLQNASEPVLRLAAFAAVFAVMALLEVAIPKRTLIVSKLKRWPTNLSMVALGGLTVRALAWLSVLVAVPLASVAAAAYAGAHGWGLLAQWSSGPDWAKSVIAILVLDFAIYLQHVASHRVPMLWRIHRMHHADIEFDVTTAARFHPLEIGLSMLYKVVWILALGASATAVLIFEILLNACAMFNHANVGLPGPLDGLLRLVLVTPDMHRVHHSVLSREHNTNYGFNLSVWDRLFATYTKEPRDGHLGMTIGLSPYQDEAPARLWWSLALPWQSLSRKKT